MIAPKLTRCVAAPWCALLLLTATQSDAADRSKTPANPFIKVQEVQKPAATSGGTPRERLDDGEHRVPLPLRDRKPGYRVRQDEDKGGVIFGNGVKGRIPPAGIHGTQNRYTHGGGAKGSVPEQVTRGGLLQRPPPVQAPAPSPKGQSPNAAKGADDGSSDNDSGQKE